MIPQTVKCPESYKAKYKFRDNGQHLAPCMLESLHTFAELIVAKGKKEFGEQIDV